MSIANQKLLDFFKLIVLVASVVVIYFQFKNKMISWGDLTLLRAKLCTVKAVLLLLITFLLMLLNWSLESMKWKVLMNGVEDISFFQAIKGVLGGLAIGFATPNRVGEFVGKIAYLKSENRVNGAMLSFVGSSAQLLITIQAGLVAFIMMEYNSTNVDVFVSPLALVIFLIVTFCWFISDKLVRFFSRISWFKKWNNNFEQLATMDKKKMLVIYGISLVRYLVFPIQYFILFYMLDANIGWFDCFINTATSYLLLAVVPTYTIAEIGARGSMNLTIFSDVASPFVILSATILIWIINLIIPASMGLMIIAKTNFNKND
jgi:hypothetical protein